MSAAIGSIMRPAASYIARMSTGDGQATSELFSGMHGTVLSGFVDLQVNGGFGHDFTDDPGSIWEVGADLPRYGVSAFLPTVTSAPVEVPVQALEVLAAGPPEGWVGARPLGLHVEGPMISPRRRGTHPADSLIPPSLEAADRLVAAGPPLMVTLAPELAGAEEVVRRLVAAGTVVSMGHSDAASAEAQASFEWGVSHATHLFNAMSGLDHRSPGVAAAILLDEKMTTGLIADGIHIAADMLRLAFRVLGPDRIALVTDAIAAMGAGDGAYRIGKVPVEVRGVEVRNGEGNLAGSAATMDHVARTMREATGCTLEEVSTMASSTPSGVVGHRPHPGDRVLVDENLQVLATAVGGKIIYRRANP